MSGEPELDALNASLDEVAHLGVGGTLSLHRAALEAPVVFWRQWAASAGLAPAGEPEADVGLADALSGLRFNFADQLLRGRGGADDAVALVTCHADGRLTRWSRRELRVRVEAFAQALRARGVGEGDRVVAMPRSDGQAVVAALAAAAVGASLAIGSPEMGAPLLVERFRPLAPKLLLAHAAAMPHDTGLPLAARVEELIAGLPSLEGLVVLDDAAERLAPQRIEVVDLSRAAHEADPAPFDWRRLPFDWPLFVTPTIGPAGRPESLVHGAGGVLLEHTKEHRLHLGLMPGDTLFVPASVASTLWLWQLSALASGAAIALYDGPVRDAGTLWRVAQDTQASVMVAGAPYLKLGEHADLAVGREFQLGGLRQLWYWGTTLDEGTAHWVRRSVKDLPLRTLCFSPDLLSCLLLGRGEGAPELETCSSLGFALQVGAGGELVCTNQVPSRPLGFLDDPDGRRFRATYLERHPGAWASGERVERPEGDDEAVLLRGRVDGLMNVRGARVAAAEVLAALRAFPEIRQAMVVEQQLPAVLGEGRAVMLVEMREGETLDGALIARLRRRLTEVASSAHVPDLVLAVQALPRGNDGAVCEELLRELVNGRPLPDILPLQDPASLDALRTEPALWAPAVPLGPLPPPPAPGWRSRQDHEAYLKALWEQIFGFSPIGLDDDFFELGGHSLLAARIFADIKRSTQQELAPSTLLKAPTIRQLAAVMDQAAWDLPVPLVQLRPGRGRPFFLVHSLAGTFLELWAVLRALDTERAVYGLQARAAGDEHAPYVGVREMARDYIGHMRRVQPTGPYAVGGYSFGGLVAYEIAQQLSRAGETVELVTLIDTHVHGRYLPLREWVSYCIGWLGITLRRLRSMPLRGQLDYLHKKGVVLMDRARVGVGLPPKRPELVGDLLREANFPPALRRVRGAMLVALREYRPEPYAGKVVFLRAERPSPGDPMPVWRKVVRGGLEVDVTPGDHDEMILGANAKALALALARHL